MIADDVVAAKVAERLKASFAALDESAAIVRENCSDAEVNDYIAAAGNICGEIIFKLMEPLYEKHPILKPKGWNDV